MDPLEPPKSYVPRILFFVFCALLLVTCIHVPHPDDFVLEHVMTVALLIGLPILHRYWAFSNLSYGLIFAFMLLHILGAHYTYSEVPYDAWFEAIFGTTLNAMCGFERNHYDRLVHFSFGLLFVYPIREVLVRVAKVKGFWSYYFPLDAVISFSAIYELLEWAVAVKFGGDMEATYLGTQGDIWDAHKDMLLASIGGLVTMCIAAAVLSRKPAVSGAAPPSA